MKTLDLEIARSKTAQICEMLKGLSHFLADSDGRAGLEAYHAAKAVTNGNLRVGVERRCAAVKKATKAFSVIVSIANNCRGIPTVRIYSPTKQTEIFL